MKFAIGILFLFVLSAVLIWKSGMLNPTSFGDKIAKKSPAIISPADIEKGNMPSMKLDSKDKKKEDQVVIFYRFVHRPVPAGLGSVDLPSNSVWKEVDKSEEPSTKDEWLALDVPLASRRIRVQITELSVNDSSGFSLSKLAVGLQPILEQGTTTVSTSAGSISSNTPTSMLAGIPVEMLQGAVVLLNQSVPSLRSELKLDTKIQMINGVAEHFSDFSEQSSPSTTTTQVSVNTSETVRNAGLDLTMTPFISDQTCNVTYTIVNTQPSSSTTQSGASLAGQVELTGKPVVLLDSERVQIASGVDHLLFIPVGANQSKIRKVDIITMSVMR